MTDDYEFVYFVELYRFYSGCDLWVFEYIVCYNVYCIFICTTQCFVQYIVNIKMYVQYRIIYYDNYLGG